MIAQGYKKFRILSLDVVLGAIISAAMVVKLLEVQMPWIFWVALPLSVWILYTADHLMDAYRLQDQAHTERHYFHFLHFRSIAIVWCVGILLGIILVPIYAPWPMILFGLGLGLFSLLHLLLVSLIGNRTSWLYHKELGVGLVYTLGVWGGPVVLFPKELDIGILGVYVQFFLLAMINLWLFSMYEIDTDEKDGHTSFIRQIGQHAAQWGIGVMGGVILILGTYLWGFRLSDPAIQWIFIAMLLILWLLAFLPHLFRQHKLYRIWGDGVFCFPVIYLLF